MSANPLHLAFWQRRTRKLLGGLLVLLAVTTVLVRVSGEPSVRIVELGFSPVVGADGPNEGAAGISWAAIVENTRDRVAYGITLRLTYRDEEGTTDDGYLQIVDTLLPGQRVGVGGGAFEGDIYGLEGPVTGVDVDVDEVARWESPEDHDAITARDMWVGYSPDNLLTVTFTAEGLDEDGEDGEVGDGSAQARGTAVLRDGDGQIVGAATGPVGSPAWPEGSNIGVLTAGADVRDVATAEAYVFTSTYQRS